MYDELSQREQQVLALVVDGCTNKAIGRELGISHRTVEVYRGQLMEKLGARGTADLVRIALCSGSLTRKKASSSIGCPAFRLARLAERSDLNPRTPCDVASFQDWCLQPLGHLSVTFRISGFAGVAVLWPRERFGGVNSVASQWDTFFHLPVFKTGALNHSATLPAQPDQAFSRVSREGRQHLASSAQVRPKGFYFPMTPFEIAPMTAAALTSALRVFFA